MKLVIVGRQDNIPKKEDRRYAVWNSNLLSIQKCLPILILNARRRGGNAFAALCCAEDMQERRWIGYHTKPPAKGLEKTEDNQWPL